MSTNIHIHNFKIFSKPSIVSSIYNLLPNHQFVTILIAPTMLMEIPPLPKMTHTILFSIHTCKTQVTLYLLQAIFVNTIPVFQPFFFWGGGAWGQLDCFYMCILRVTAAYHLEIW